MTLYLILLNSGLSYLEFVLRYFCFKKYNDRLITIIGIEFRSIYHYCFLRGLSPREAHEEMMQAYGVDCPHEQTIRKWYKRFEDGLESIEDSKRKNF